jgi:hypothetical protein
LATDAQRAGAVVEMVAAAASFSSNEASMLRFYTSPSEIRAACSVKRGQLTLFPLTDLKNVVSKQMGTSQVVSLAGKPICYLEEPSKVKTESTAGFRKESVVSAFWWVKIATDDADVNMKVSKHVTEAGYSFPVLENCKALKEFDLLMVKAPALKKAGSSAGPQGGLPAAKKQKA